MDGYPFVSCICPTFNRIRVLEEMLECFLRQDYPGRKELIILNDCPSQTLRFDHPDVRVINVPRQYSSLGTKHKELAAAARGEYMCLWDDDDIKLPNAISYCVEHMRKSGARLFYPDSTLTSYSGKISRLVASPHFHLYGMWTKELYDAVGGYEEGKEYADASLQGRFLAHLKNFRPEPVPPEELYAFYRINVGIHQISFCHSVHTSDDKVCQDYRDMVRARAVPLSGPYTLQPHWDSDYVADVREAVLGGRLRRDIYYVTYNYGDNKITVYAGICDAVVKFMDGNTGNLLYQSGIRRTEEDINSNWTMLPRQPGTRYTVELWAGGECRYRYDDDPSDAGRGTFELTPCSRSLLRRNDSFMNLENAVCAEVGVLRGDFSACLLACNPARLHLVDCWRTQGPEYQDAANAAQDVQDSNYESVVNRFKDNDNVKITRKMSAEAALDFPEGYFDFVYIDANHSYDACMQDMLAWWPRIKTGGHMCGHDLSFAGVRRAVSQFCSEHELPCMELTRDSWGIRKVS